MPNEITSENLDRFIAEMKARKLVGPATKEFFLSYYDLDSIKQLDTRTLELVNRKLSRQRFPTVDDSEVLLHEETTQDDFWKRRVGN